MSPTPQPLPRIHLIRHGETEWSLKGRHTSHSDIPLTTRGEEQARRLALRLRGIAFTRVLTSPRLRARETCRLARLDPAMEVEENLCEWDYGDYEARTTAEIQGGRPDWNLFVDGAPGGESPADVLTRAKAVVRHLTVMDGDIAVFSHGHFLRVLAATWINLPMVYAQRLELSTASLGVLSHEHNLANSPVISLWNETAVTALRPDATGETPVQSARAL